MKYAAKYVPPIVPTCEIVQFKETKINSTTYSFIRRMVLQLSNDELKWVHAETEYADVSDAKETHMVRMRRDVCMRADCS